MFKEVLSLSPALCNSRAVFILLEIHGKRSDSDPQEQLCRASGTRRPAHSVAVMEQPMSLSTSPSVSWSKLKSRVTSLFCTHGTFSAHSLGLSEDTFLKVCYSQ